MEIWEGWMKVDGTEIVDLEGYIFQQLAERKVGTRNAKHDVEIMIGTDSMVKTSSKKHRGKSISFMTVIVFKKGNNGCHIIKRRDDEPAFGFVPTAIKLNGEVNRTAALAFWFRDTLKIDPHVHLDLNPKESEASFEVYKYIKGYFENLGYVCEYKPNSAAAMSAADHYV
jgi:predicted RNase H-related nuclease YkuK (DUF458 family)